MRRLLLLAVLLFGLSEPTMSLAQPLPVVTVTTNTPMVSEPNGIAAFVIFKDSGPDVTVRFEMAGTATLGVDYLIIGGGSSVVLPSGANIALVQVQVLDDFEVEPDETITLNILPDPAYAISTNSSATIKARSNDPLPDSPPLGAVSISLNPAISQAIRPVIVAPRTSVTATAEILGGGYPSVATLYLDAQRIGSMQRRVFEGHSWFTYTFVSPLAGLHTLTAVLTDSSGAATAGAMEFRVADALVAPSSAGVFSNATLVTSIPATNVVIFTRFDGRTTAAYVEFPVPRAATNWTAALFATAYSEMATHQLFTYAAEGKVTSDDAQAATEFVGDFPASPGFSAGPLQIDVTPWTKTNSTGYIGFKLQIDPASTSSAMATAAVFSNFYLAFFSKTNDVPLQFEWLNFPTNRSHRVDVPLNMQLRLYDPDSRVTSVRIYDGFPRGSDNLIAEAASDLAPGTNILSLEVTNLIPGLYSFVIEGITESGSVTNAYHSIAFFKQDDPAHRWLGTDGDSRSFYVVDAAGCAWVWGDNEFGQLGLGFKGGIVTRPAMLPVPPGKKWRQFTSNSYCAVAVTDDGLIYGMGENSAGGTSIFTTADPNAPVSLPINADEMYIKHAGLTESGLWVVDGSDRLHTHFGPDILSASVSAMETAGNHAVAIAAGMLVYGPQEFGNPAFDTSHSGATLPWLFASTCAMHSLALDSKGQLFGWGPNTAGQFPFPSVTNVLTPIKARFPANVTAWSRVEAGRLVSLAVDATGKLYSWGQRGYTGSAEPYEQFKIVPVTMPTNEMGWLDLQVGWTFALALSASGNLYVWGDIPGSASPRHVELPELVTGLPDLLNPTQSTATAVTFEPQSIRVGAQLDVDIIVPRSANLTLQSSSNLVTWTTLTNTSATAGKTHIEASPPGGDQVFIRVNP